MTPEAGGNSDRGGIPFNYFPEGSIISKYRIIRRIGSGGMGDVYLAKDSELGRQVALKFLHQTYSPDDTVKMRFEREAQAAAKLDNPNIVTIYETGEYKGQPYLAMQFIQGQPLCDFIKDRKLSVNDILNLTIQICHGLREAHNAGIVHRDIKPGNIMVDKDGLVKILDFGLAKAIDSSMLTRDGAVLGTAGYMSPEQIKGMELDNRSDIFSVGIIFYEMLTGVLPFDNRHMAAAVYSILNEDPKPLSTYSLDIPAGLQPIMDKVLAKSPDSRYRDVGEFISELEKLKKEIESPGQTSEILSASTRKPSPFKQYSRASSIAIAAVVLFFIIYKLLSGPGYKPIENSLAVFSFENRSDPEDPIHMGDIIADALENGLSELNSIQMISNQKLEDIRNIIVDGRSDENRFDRASALDLALKARAQRVIMGSIFQSGYDLVLTSQLIEVISGKVIATQRVVGKPDDGVLPMVDRLTAEVIKDIDPQESLEKRDNYLITDSLDAYSYYLEGRKLYFKLYWEEASRYFDKAIDIDSTFAMAYYGKALLKLKENSPLTKELISKALKYSSKLKYRERIFIKSLSAVIAENYDKAIADLQECIDSNNEESQDAMWLKREALYWMAFIYKSKLRDPEKALEKFMDVLRIDSLHKATYNELVYLYKDSGDYEKALWAANKQIEIAPYEANPYDTKGDLYVGNGMISKAIESFKKAIEIKPDFYNSLRKLGNMYIFSGNYPAAESCYQQLVSSSEYERRTEGRTCLAWVPLFQGRFDDALRLLDVGIATDKLELIEGQQTANKYFIKALILEEKGDFENALTEMRQCMNLLRRIMPGTPADGRHFYARLLAESGDFESANEAANQLQADIEHTNRAFMPLYWFAKGSIEYFEGDYDLSIEDFERSKASPLAFHVRYLLALSYYRTGNIERMISELESMQSDYSRNRLIWGIQTVKSYYYLGKAYELSGWKERAIDQYKTFLKIWENADSESEEIKDARKSLSTLLGKT